MTKLHIIKAVALAGLLGLSQAASAQVAVIVNPKSPVAAMTQEQVAAIFLGKSATLPSGATAVPADLPEGSATHELFYSKAAGKTSAQVKATWARLTFSGKATPPKELGSRWFGQSRPDRRLRPAQALSGVSGN